MKTNEVKKLIEFSDSIYKNLGEYIKKYVGYVKNSMPREYWSTFCVEELRERDGLTLDVIAMDGTSYPALFGKSVIWSGSTIEPMDRDVAMEFASRIPSIMERGLKEIEAFNKRGEEILSKQVELKNE